MNQWIDLNKGKFTEPCGCVPYTDSGGTQRFRTCSRCDGNGTTSKSNWKDQEITEQCYECLGEGKKWFDYDDKYHRCSTCDGEGRVNTGETNRIKTGSSLDTCSQCKNTRLPQLITQIQGSVIVCDKGCREGFLEKKPSFALADETGVKVLDEEFKRMPEPTSVPDIVEARNELGRGLIETSSAMWLLPSADYRFEPLEKGLIVSKDGKVGFFHLVSKSWTLEIKYEKDDLPDWDRYLKEQYNDDSTMMKQRIEGNINVEIKKFHEEEEIKIKEKNRIAAEISILETKINDIDGRPQSGLDLRAWGITIVLVPFCYLNRDFFLFATVDFGSDELGMLILLYRFAFFPSLIASIFAISKSNQEASIKNEKTQLKNEIEDLKKRLKNLD